MANAMPWSVRGIDPDIREQAVEAAHRSGMSVGQWLNQILAGNLDEDEDEGPAAAPRKRRGGRVDTLATRLERLGRPRLQTAAHRLTDRDNDNAPVLDLIESAVQAIERLEEESASRRSTQRPSQGGALEDRLAGLLDALEQQRVAPAPSAGRVSSMGRRSGQQQGFGRSQRQFEDDPAFSQAIAEIEARRRDLDLAQGNNPAQPGAAGVRVSASVMRASGDESRHLDAMRQQLDLLLSRIDDMRTQPKPDTGRIHDRLDQIANKVEDISRQPKPDTSRLHDHLEQLAGRIEDMRREPRPDTLRLQDRVEQIATRMDEWRARPSEDVALVRRDLASLAATIESLSPDRLVGMVEGAVARIAEKSYRAHQQEPMPESVLDSLAEMQSDIRATLRDIVAAQNSDRVAHEVGIVARRLDQIGQVAPDLSRVDEIMQETATIKTLIGQAMHTQPLEALTHQLEALARQIERSQGVDNSALIETITTIRDRVDRIDPGAAFAGIEARLTAISAIEAKLGAISGIEAKLGELAQDISKIDGIVRDVSKIDDIARDVSKLAKEAQPFPQLESIAARLERIDRVLDHNREQPLAGLDRLADKLDKIGVSLDKVASAPQPVQHDTLVDMLDQLSKRMDQAQSASADTAALDALQEDIARLTTRIEQTPSNVLGLEGLERSVTDLFSQLDITRREIREASETTAQQAAREAVKTVVRDESTDTLAAEGLLLLKRDLGEFKSAQTDADKRTRQMLENLHSTLEALGTRLAQLDMPRPAQATAAPSVHAPTMSAPAPSPAPAPSRMTDERTSAGAATVAAFRETMANAPAATKPANPSVQHGQSASSSEEFSDLPLEPGQRPGMRPEMDAVSDPVMTSDPRSNFIAAARRAAQAAAERSQAALEEEEQTSKKSKLNLKALLSRKGDKVSKADISSKTIAPSKTNAARDLLKSGSASDNEDDAKPQSFLARSRRPILLGLAALVFALGALKVLTNRNGGGALDVVPPVMPQMERSLPTPPAADQRSEAPTEQNAPAVQERTEGPSIPTISPDKSGPSIPPPGASQLPDGVPTLGGKRAQRLQDASALSQADPITVGSIAPDGSARPIETGRETIRDLVGQANLKGQDKLREAALGGNAAALFEIGARYADGRGVNRDPKLAMRWFEQGAATGHAPSQYRLASLYREGKGVPKDAGLAFQWFDRAAAQGHVLAMHNAAVLLAEGVHGTPDYAGAALWFKRAAEHGVKDSQFNVAILFARGLGVAQDLNESFRWFSAAAAQGDQDAAKKRDDIAARMSKDQLAKEREKLKSFTPMKPNPAANEPGAWEQAAAKVKTSRVQ